MTESRPPRAPLDLRRPRDVGALIADAFGVYFREFRTFFLISVAVVVPVELIVNGIGLGQLTSPYDKTPPVAQALIQQATYALVITPLVAAMSITALLDVAEGRRPRALPAIQRGLDVFPPLLLVLVLYWLGVGIGLLAILPGIYLLVAGSLGTPATVIEKRRGIEAIRRSMELVRGSWWRVLGVVVLSNFLTAGVAALIGAPFLGAAESTGSAAFQLVGNTIGGVLLAPPAALIVCLLYFDQRRRTGG